jgi:hypothetical protein
VDQETELMKARLNALETLVFVVAKKDASLLEEIREVLTQEYLLAVKESNRRDEPSFARPVMIESRTPRNLPAGRAKVEAWDALCRKFGASS